MIRGTYLMGSRTVALPALTGLAALIVLFLAGCGGGGSSMMQQPQPDFIVSASPNSVSAQVGSTTPPVAVTITAVNGFSGSVQVALQGLPTGTTASPSSTFTVNGGMTQSVTFQLSGSAPIGPASITVSAASGSLSHTTQVTLTAQAIVRTYQNGTVLYLESGNNADTTRIGLETRWGGSIVEVSVNGTEYVNREDTGREIQLSFRDSNRPYWNPTMGGDEDSQGTPTLAWMVNPDSLYTKSQPLEWYVEENGGGVGHPITEDMQVEQTVFAVASQPHTFRAHYKVTHLGSDLHTDAPTEYPAVYTNRDYNQFVYYGGSAPWTNSAVTTTTLPDLPQFSPNFHASEHWGALVNVQNQGLMVYVPSPYPYVDGFSAPDSGGGGPTDNYTNYFAVTPNWTIRPGFVLEGDIYIIAGDLNTARNIVYQLHQTVNEVDISAPLGATDVPSANATVSGTVVVGGWAFDDVGVAKIEVLVDGSSDGTATYGSSRPDVPAVYPGAPVNSGYSYTLDTTKYSSGPHIMNVRVTDMSGNAAVFANVPLIFAN